MRLHRTKLTAIALVIERHPIKPPGSASPEEYNCQWYQLTDRVQYLPGGLYSGKVSYNVCFHNLAKGLQTHCFAPAGLDIKGKWTIGGSLPGEMKEPTELGLGLPKHGLYLREDVDMKCNVLMTAFVKKTLKKAHVHLVARLIQKAHFTEADLVNDSLSQRGSLRGCDTSPSLRPGHSSTAYSDVSSVRSSQLGQSPGLPQDTFSPINSAAHHNMDPAYRDARDSYAAPQVPPKIPVPDAYPQHQGLLRPPYPVELPSQRNTAAPVELPASASPQQHELPARLYDNYQ